MRFQKVVHQNIVLPNSRPNCVSIAQKALREMLLLASGSVSATRPVQLRAPVKSVAGAETYKAAHFRIHSSMRFVVIIWNVLKLSLTSEIGSEIYV